MGTFVLWIFPLGFVTAGLLWLDFYHINNLENKAAELYSRICTTVGDQFSLQNLHKSKPIKKERMLRSQLPPAPCTYYSSGQYETGIHNY
jgi:hypothetical protein